MIINTDDGAIGKTEARIVTAEAVAIGPTGQAVLQE